MTDPEPSTPRVFITESVEVVEGERAADLIDAQLAREVAAVDPERGVVRVDRARWEEAQRYERRTWLEKARYAASDRNEYHRERFDDYAALSGRRFERAIELGCGPFTNLRLIVRRCAVSHIHLLDPLLSEYLAHPFCQYRGGRLGGLLRNVPPLSALRTPRAFLHNRLDALQVGGLTGRQVTLESSMIESYATRERFDLLVMINVIEHCQDLGVVLDKILELLRPGGVFVFADKLYDAEEVRRLASVLYDAGHPIRTDRRVLERWLDAGFEPLLRREYHGEQSFRGIRMRNDELYFIGRKRA